MAEDADVPIQVGESSETCNPDVVVAARTTQQNNVTMEQNNHIEPHVVEMGVGVGVEGGGNGNEVVKNNPYMAHTHQSADDEEASLVNDDDRPADHLHESRREVVPLHELEIEEQEQEAELLEAKKNRSVITAGVESITYLYSLVLLVFSVIVVMAALFTGQTGASQKNIPPWAAFLIFWFLLIWLAMIEGGQGCLVGLQPLDKDLYKTSHPLALKSASLAHKGDNMERFIVGRQFLVVLLVFVTNMMGGAIPGGQVLGLPTVVNEIFLDSGLAMILTAIMIGQLTAQVNAAVCMLDFINNYFMVFSTYVSLGIEFSGLMHCVYLVQIIFAKITGKPIETDEPPRNVIQNVFFWGRVLMSLAILGFSFAVTLGALFQGKTTMWDGVPNVVSVVILFVLMAFVGLMEGMQIALFTVINMPQDEIARATTARRNCNLAFKGDNLQAFLIGRQICVTGCMFVVARITTLSYGPDDPTIFGVPHGLQEFFNTGLLGAVITTIVASLAWRIVASSFPLQFLSNPLVYLILRLCLIIEASGICSASWFLARYNKLLWGLQPDEVYLEGAEKHTSEPVTRREKDIDRLVVVIKYTYSLVLLVFSVVMVMAAMFTSQTAATSENIPSWAAFVIFWFLLVWLAMIEGGQGCLVGLQPVDKVLYEDTHPIALKSTALAHRGDNMERFIVGRQFLVVLIVFVTNMMGGAVPGADVLGLPPLVNELFLSTGIAMILIATTIGQLAAQVNAAVCMLDFINNYFMVFSTYVSLGIEFSGLMHSVYLVQILFSKITGHPIETGEPPRTVIQNIFFWARVLMSVAVLAFAFTVTLGALFQGKTTMWEGVPNGVSVVILFVLMAFVGLMEGMQIALFAVINMPSEEVENAKIAKANCELTFRGDNLAAFLIGRQICVTCCMFVVARITTLAFGPDDPTIYGVPEGVQNFFNTGLLGAVITTIVASLAWRIVASSFPLAFLSNPLIYLIIRLCLLIEASGVCSAAWVLARYSKMAFGYQPDEVYLEGAERHTSAPANKREKDIDVTAAVIKYLYSTALVVFSVCIVMALIFSRQTKLAMETHPLGAFFIFWFLLLWLAMIEGGQGCLVGLQPVDKSLYAETHPITLKSTALAHKGDNMERFIVGRQFLVVLIVFMTNMAGAAIPGASVFNLSSGVQSVFLNSGLAMTLTTIVLGQLTAQVTAANCMLDFINNYFMLFSTYVSLGIEFSGLLHSVYLVQILFSKITGQPIETDEPPKSTIQNIFFWVRVLMSLAILCFAFTVTLGALFQGKTTMWEGVPEIVSVVLLFVLMAFVGMMEGMQIALFSVINMPRGEIAKASIAMANCDLAFRGQNLQAFLIGRQIVVTCCMFVVARITTLSYGPDDPPIFGVSEGVQNFFNTGLLGVVITTIVGSLAWRIIASSFPLAFLSNPLIYVIIRLCLVIEASGICSASWLFALMHKLVAGFKIDEVYIGTVDEVLGKDSILDIEEGGEDEVSVT